MRNLKHAIPHLHRVYSMIAEPRVRRLIYFVIYLLLIVAASISLFLKVPRSFQNVLGGTILVYVCGALIVVGALVCAVSVLPGVWMFERAGLVALTTGIAMYSLVLLALGASFMVVIVPAMFILFFALRWLDIWEFLLAPREE